MAKKESPQNNLALSTKAEDIIRRRMENLVKRLSCDIKKEAFEDQAVECIETTKNVCDVKSFAVQVRKHGAVQTRHRIGEQFLESTRKLTGTLNDISDLEMKENFGKFLKALESKRKDIEEEKLDSKSLICSEEDVFSGIELTLHSNPTAAVKVSVESVVENLVSRYENHFDKKRQLKETCALDEMEIAENGPELVHADSIFSRVMNKYWHEMSQAGTWHFCHKTDDIRTFYKNSKVVEKYF